MSAMTSLGIVILAMLIMASLQLVPGVFALFYHYALGKHSKKQASILSLYFILGAEVIAACLFVACYYLTYVLYLDTSHPESNPLTWILAGIFVALAFASFFYYFRRSPGTRLFISAKFSQALDRNAKSVETRSDAFLLGALSGTCELVFTLPLYFLTALEIMKMNAEFYSSHLLTILYIVIPTLPLFFIRWRYQSGHNLADIQRSRVRDKLFTRIILTISYLTIAILLICFRTIN